MKNPYIKTLNIIIALLIAAFVALLYYLPIARLSDARIIYVFFTPDKTAFNIIKVFFFLLFLYIFSLWGKIIKNKCLSNNNESMIGDFITSSAIGFTLLIIYTFFLLSLGIFYKISILPFFILPFFFRKINRKWECDIRAYISDIPGKASFVDAIYIFVPLIILFPTFILLFVPSLNWDELVYHLVIPKAYMASHRFIVPDYIFLFHTPHNINIFYSGISILFNATDLCVFFNAYMGISCAAITYIIGREYFSKNTGILAGMIFLLAPVVTKELRVAYSDLGTTFFFILSLYYLLNTLRSGRSVELILSAVFAGITFGSKYTALYCVATLIVPTLLLMRKKSLTSPILFWLISGILVVPWLIKNYIMTGNPVFPNMYSLFGGKNWNSNLSALINIWLQEMGTGKTIGDFILLPWRLSVLGWYQYELFADTLSPFFFFPLIFLPAVIVKDYLEKCINKTFFLFFAIAVIYLICWFYGSQQMRFLVPGLPLFAITASYCVNRIIDTLHKSKEYTDRESEESKPASSHLSCQKIFIFTYLLFAFYSFGIEQEAYELVRPALHTAFGNLSTSDYIKKTGRANTYDTMQWINTNLSENAKILMFFENRTYYLSRKFVADGSFEASWVVENLSPLKTPLEWLEWMKQQKITHVLWHDGHWRTSSGAFILRFYPDFYDNFSAFRGKYLTKIYEQDRVYLYKINF